MDSTRVMKKLAKGKWKPEDVAANFLYEFVSPFDFVKLLQTRNGLALWNTLKKFRFTNRGAAVWKCRNMGECEITISYVLRFSICYTAGYRSFCGHHGHSLLERIPWHCPSQKPLPRFAFQRAEKHLRCYILLCGIKKFRNSTVLHRMDRFVVRMIAQDAWNLQFHDLRDIEQFVNGEERGKDLRDYFHLALMFIYLIYLIYDYVY